MNIIFKTDTYKLDHINQYPKGTDFIFANITPRTFGYFNQAFGETEKIPVFGLDYIIETMKQSWWDTFFSQPYSAIMAQIEQFEKTTLIPFSNELKAKLKELHKLQYLPLDFEYLPNGTMISANKPILTLWNTHKDFFWLVTYVETYLLNHIWPIITSAAASYKLRLIAEKYGNKTCEDLSHVPFQFHDFSQRGAAGNEGAMLTGMGHLYNFKGSDNIPALIEKQRFYKDDFVGTSVVATEHSVMCAGTKEHEKETYIRLIKTYPSGILSVVSDTWNIFNVVENILPEIKDKVLARDGKLVIRPDGMNPIHIICGNSDPNLETKWISEKTGLIPYLDKIFGHTINSKGYKELNKKIGLIFGDGIDHKNSEIIFKKLEEMGYASNNVVFGAGAFIYQWQISRDSLGFAQKATMIRSNEKWIPIQKNPYGTPYKKSYKGFVRTEIDDNGNCEVIQTENFNSWMLKLTNEQRNRVKWLNGLTNIE